MVQGDVTGVDDVLVRVHSECLTGDVFGSMRCDCGVQLDAAMKTIADEGPGVVVYLRGHEGRGIGIGHKIRAYELQDEGHDTVDANELRACRSTPASTASAPRSWSTSASPPCASSPTTRPSTAASKGFGLDITDRVPSITAPNPENIRYLRTKAEQMGHLLEGLDDLRPTRRRRRPDRPTTSSPTPGD